MGEPQKPPLRGLHFALARVTIELRSPLTIGTGASDGLRDVVCVEDANGLPTLPGTSLAGVLRHALAGDRDPDRDADCVALFGFQHRDKGASSCVEVSWGHVHDAQDQPVPIRRDIPLDAFLVGVRDGVVRDHVRIGYRGAADETGKFETRLVPTGARFSFEIVVHAAPGRTPTADLDRLLAILYRPGLRIGGRTRRGFGAIWPDRIGTRTFDLRQPADRRDFRRLPRSLAAKVPAGLLTNRTDLNASVDPHRVGATVKLNPKDTWIFGGGRPERPEHYRREPTGKRGDRPRDRVPLSEPRIVWTGPRGSQRGAFTDAPCHVIPASAIKGALRHRVAFHARRLRGDWADPAWPSWDDPALAHPPTHQEEWLFGRVKRRGGEDDRPGRVVLDDAVAETVLYAEIDHVSLNRFTQGPMDGLLFDEATLYRGPALELRLSIDTRGEPPPRFVRRALRCAIDDLVAGRLPLGAGVNRGHGTFLGKVDWDDDGAWLGGDR